MGYGIKKCSECGKTFLPSEGYMYKRGLKFQDSYTCYRKAGGDNGKRKSKLYVEPKPGDTHL